MWINKLEELRALVDIFMEPVCTMLLFSLGLYLVLGDNVETGVALATSATVYWFRNNKNATKD